MVILYLSSFHNILKKGPIHSMIHFQVVCGMHAGTRKLTLGSPRIYVCVLAGAAGGKDYDMFDMHDMGGRE